jgi:uncharacterized protein YecT (DUF1311 family)
MKCIAAILSFAGVLLLSAFEVQATEAGDVCTDKTVLPPGFLCGDELVINCNDKKGHLEYLFCRSAELKALNLTLDTKYQAILKRYKAPNTFDTDYKQAKSNLIEAQRLWAAFKSTDCNMPIHLNKKGISQSPMMIDCEIAHTENRIKDFDSGFYD